MTRRERNAIVWLIKDGFKPTLGGFRDLHHFEMLNRDSGEIEFFDIDNVLKDYDQNLKDERRMRAAQRTRKGQR